MPAISCYLQKHKQCVIEAIGLLVFFLLVASISYYHVEQSISVVKYHLQFGIRNLSDNYELYHHSFKQFFLQTGAFHTGNSEAEWRTVFYLLPLFIFCDLLGGLSLKAMCLFTVTTSLIFLFLFYWWIRSVWNKQAAFFAVCFFGLSAVFQEIARSGSYDTYSLLIAMIWILFFFRCREPQKPVFYVVLGLLTGLTWYGYGILRCLTLVALVQVCLSKDVSKKATIGLFLAGFTALILPGVVLMLNTPDFLAHYHEPYHLLFLDRENVQNKREFFSNLTIFIQRMRGADQQIEPWVVDIFHAHFLNPWLIAPLLIGIFTRPKPKTAWLLSFMIFIIPICTATVGYVEARRSLLYVIPIYCFIGLGAKVIYGWIKKRPNPILRWGGVLLMAGIACWVVAVEMKIVFSRVLTTQRDLGLLVFAEHIKAKHFTGDMYYLQPGNGLYGTWGFKNMTMPQADSLYAMTYEADIMRVAMLEKGESGLNVHSLSLKSQLSFPAFFYVLKSPLISFDELSSWAANNKLSVTQMDSYPVVNLPRRTVEEPFRFYAVRKVP